MGAWKLVLARLILLRLPLLQASQEVGCRLSSESTESIRVVFVYRGVLDALRKSLQELPAV